MSSLVKVVKPTQDYQQWVASELSNGDIIDVYTSLGGRTAHTVTIESINGQTVLAFNVAKTINKEYNANNQSWVGNGRGFPSKTSVNNPIEIQETKPNIIIEAETIQLWLGAEVQVRDIKIITKSAGLKITVT